MIEAAGRYRHAVVIGGGLLGLEAANGLMLRGMDVTVVHLMPTGSWNASSTTPPARCCRRSLEAARAALLYRRQDPGPAGRRTGPRVRGPAVRRPRTARRPGGHGRRHPPQYRPGRGHAGCIASAASSSTTPCRPSPTRASMPSANASAIAASTYGLVAPLFEQAKVCANASGAASASAAMWARQTVDQAQGDRHRPVLRGRLHWAARTPRRSS